MVPGRLEWNFNNFEANSSIWWLKYFLWVAIRWLSLKLNGDKSIHPVTGLVRQQAMTWANVDPDLNHHMASLGHIGLKMGIIFIKSWFICWSFRKPEYLIRFSSIILPHWNNTSSWNLSTWRARANLLMLTLQTKISYIVNTMSVDGLATQEARASTAMILTYWACPECCRPPAVSVNMHNTTSYAFLTPFATHYHVHGQCSITIITAIHSSHNNLDATNLDATNFNTWWLIPLGAHYIVMPQRGSCMLGEITARADINHIHTQLF